MKARIANFVRERNEALFSLDKKKIETYLRKRGCEVPDNEIVFWAGVYKSICHITDAPADLVLKAKIWLFEHGMSPEVRLGYASKIH